MLSISAKGFYAIKAMSYLGRNHERGPISIKEISLNEKLPLIFLEQILLRLKKQNILKSYRGAKGGFVLSQTLENITIQSILEASDENFSNDCPVSACKESCTKTCSTHQIMDNAQKNIKNYLQSLTLEKVINDDINFS